MHSWLSIFGRPYLYIQLITVSTLTIYFAGTSPDSEWPQSGAVTVEDVSVRYAKTLDPVLSNISLNVKPGQKVSMFSVSRILA